MRAQSAPPQPGTLPRGQIEDPVAEEWSGIYKVGRQKQALDAQAYLSRAETAQKQSRWVEAARNAGLAALAGAPEDRVEKLLRDATPHLSSAQAACVAAWCGPLPVEVEKPADRAAMARFQVAFAAAAARTNRPEEARSQALIVVKRYPTSPAAKDAWDLIKKGGGFSAPDSLPIAPGATNSVFQVSYLLPLTGDYQAYGLSLRAGLEIAVAEYNVHAPLPIRLGGYETEGEGWRAAREGKRALDGGAGVLVGDVLTVPTLVLAGLANQTGVPLLSPSATDARVGATGPLVFQTGAPLDAQARALARYAVRTDKRAIIAAPANMDSAFLRPFEAEAKQQGASVVRVPASTGLRDFKPVADDLKRKRADSILLPLDPEQAELWVGGLMKQGVFLPFLATDAVDPQGFHADTRKVLEGMTAVSTDYALPQETFARVDTLAKVAYGLTADRFVRRGYLTGRVIAEALAGGADSPATFAAALRRRSGSLGFIRFDEAEASLPILSVRRGQLVRVH